MIFRGSGPVLLRNPIFYDFSGGSGAPVPPPSGSALVALSVKSQMSHHFVIAGNMLAHRVGVDGPLVRFHLKCIQFNKHTQETHDQSLKCGEELQNQCLF